MESRRAEVGRVVGRRRSARLQALELRPADVGEDRALGARGGLGVQVDGQVEALGDAPAEGARELDRTRPSSCRRAARTGSRRRRRCAGAGPRATFMSMRSMASATALSIAAATASAGPAKVSTLRLWSRSDVRSSRWTPGVPLTARGEGVDDFGAPALAEVGTHSTSFTSRESRRAAVRRAASADQISGANSA